MDYDKAHLARASEVGVKPWRSGFACYGCMTVYGKLWEPLSSNQGTSQSNMDPQEGNFQRENHSTA